MISKIHSNASGRSGLSTLGGVLAAVLLLAGPAQGQAPATVRGTVINAESLAPLQGVQVAAESRVTRTDQSGRFVLTLPAGTHQIRVEGIGWRSEVRTIDLDAGGSLAMEVRLQQEAFLLPTLVATATGERRRLNETTATVGVISRDGLRDAKPTHPSDVMGQIPGVWVSVTGGEGHMTAIRQPQSTKPLYLFLEDGVPTRSTGFFNHNGLYEVNLPQADRIEVLKGPATALHGSDAIGGVINVETRGPSPFPTAEAYLERGAFGYSRALLSGSTSWGESGVRADLNLTRTDGWRDATGYDRQSGTIRWDAGLGPRTRVRTVLTGSRIDQQTAGSSALPLDVYRSNPTENRTPISLRNVRAARVSSSIEHEGDRTLVSITPYARWNTMELLPNWSLTYDPTIYDTGHSSAGMLARARVDLPAVRSDVIVGVDVDYSPGGRTEHRVQANRVNGIFTDYSPGELIYDYDVTFRAVSPYVQANIHATRRLHLTAGMRYDDLRYDYSNKLSELQTGRWRRPADAQPSFSRLSPKLGAALEISEALNLYGNFSRGFRAPSEGQLFRQGSATNTVNLDPVIATSAEVGSRGQLGARIGYSLAAYRMHVDDDILDFVLPDGTPETQNAGRTLHQGLEVGLTLSVAEGLDGSISYSLARHEYEAWSPRSTIDYSGNEMESAPNSILNARLGYSPGFWDDSRFTIDWSRLGSFWMDADNTHRYGGHDLIDLAVLVPLPRGVELNARIANLLDERYAETAVFTAARGQEFSPGMPRSVYLGAQFRWQR